MEKGSYYIAMFPKSSWKNPLADLSKLVLGTIDRICEILEIYSDESYGQYPEMILHNILLNNETVFDHVVLDTISDAGTSSWGQPSQELTSPEKGNSGHVNITVQQFIDTIFDKHDKRDLIFDNESKKPVKSDNLGKETTAIGGQEIVGKAQMISSSEKDEKKDIATTHVAGEETDAKAGWKVLQESQEKINALMRRNLVQIKSMTIFKLIGDIGVEIDIDSPSVSPASSPEKQDSSSSGISKSPGIHQEKSKSPSTSPSQRVPSEFLPAVDNFDSIILNFLAKRFLSRMNHRKVCMEQIRIFFQKFLRDVQVLHNTINNLDFVVENLPMANEPYLTDYLVKLRSDLINKAQEMLNQTKQLVIQVEEEVKVWNYCLEKFNTFEKEHGPSLSTNLKPVAISDLKGLESHLKEICKDAYGTIILKDGRREILLNLTTDFKWLVKHFVEFLIITEILISPRCGTSQFSKDE